MEGRCDPAPTLIEIARAYILRGEAYQALQEHFTEGGFKDYTDGQKCMKRIKAIPAADVEEVRHACWIEDGYFNEPCVCSNCGEPCKDTVMGKPRWSE